MNSRNHSQEGPDSVVPNNRPEQKAPLAEASASLDANPPVVEAASPGEDLLEGFEPALYPDKHTPGDWTVSENMVFAPGFRVADLTPNDDDLGEADLGDEYSPETAEMIEANGRLIAASPKMKALLVEALNYEAEAFADDDEVDGADLVEFFAEWRQEARAVLAEISKKA